MAVCDNWPLRNTADMTALLLSVTAINGADFMITMRSIWVFFSAIGRRRGRKRSDRSFRGQRGRWHQLPMAIQNTRSDPELCNIAKQDLALCLCFVCRTLASKPDVLANRNGTCRVQHFQQVCLTSAIGPDKDIKEALIKSCYKISTSVQPMG
jgi:hypothetical protein